MPQHTCTRGAHKFLFIIYPTLNLILPSLRNRFLFIIYLTLNLMAFYGIMGVYITPNLVVASVLSGFFYGVSFLPCVQPSFTDVVKPGCQMCLPFAPLVHRLSGRRESFRKGLTISWWKCAQASGTSSPASSSRGPACPGGGVG